MNMPPSEHLDSLKLREYVRKWLAGVGPEVGFWDHWLRTKGMQWPDDYLRRLDPRPAFELDAFVPAGSSRLNILDVGSGPISRVGIASDRVAITLQACDPLALFYRQLFEAHGVAPYVLPSFAYAEALTDRYSPDTFDLVHMSNALDHSFLPLAGVNNMLAVAKVGGTVVLRHAENEALRERYSGFHQWNITERAGRLIAWRDSEEVDLSSAVGAIADVSVRREHDAQEQYDVIVAVLTKRAAVTAPLGAFKNAFDAALLLEAGSPR